MLRMDPAHAVRPFLSLIDMATSRASSEEHVVRRVASPEFASHAVAMGYLPVGAGKDRAVWRHEDIDDRVVKLASRLPGIDANAREALRWQNATDRQRPWLLPVYAADPNGMWLVMAQLGDDHDVDPDWFDRFYAWTEAYKRRDVATMPPRALIESVEHGTDIDDWAMWHGHPVMFDYA